MPSGYRATTPDNLILDTGVFSYLVGSTETFVGVTRGEMGFEPGIEYRQPSTTASATTRPAATAWWGSRPSSPASPSWRLTRR
jgi:hypothetical protein